MFHKPPLPKKPQADLDSAVLPIVISRLDESNEERLAGGVAIALPSFIGQTNKSP